MEIAMKAQNTTLLKPKHGGARKGAGRKPPDSPKIRKNIYLSQLEWLYLQSLDATSPSRAIKTMITTNTRRIWKISVDFKRREIVFFKNGGGLSVYTITPARLSLLKQHPRYQETKALGLHYAYIR
jgi:hypothetical protein